MRFSFNFFIYTIVCSSCSGEAHTFILMPVNFQFYCITSQSKFYTINSMGRVVLRDCEYMVGFIRVLGNSCRVFRGLGSNSLVFEGNSEGLLSLESQRAFDLI